MKNGKLSLFALALGALFFLCVPASQALAQPFILTKVVDTNTPIPDGSGNFTFLNPPVIDGTRLAFMGSWGTGQGGIYLTSSAPGWTISIIDSAGDVGWFSSIAVDSSNKVHIGYFDNTNADLKYATDGSGSWQVFTIDSAGDVGGNTSIAVDTNNKVHIAYYDWTNEYLKYTTNSSGVWENFAVANAGLQGAYIDIATDSNNKVHISYLDNTYYHLKYATNSSGLWEVLIIDSTPFQRKSPSIAIDSNDSVHISYYDLTNSNLRYATNASGSWQISTIGHTGGWGGETAIAIDSGNNVHISYRDYANTDLKYATNVSGSWLVSTVDSAGDVGGYSSIAVDSNNKVHISYFDWGNSDLKYATNASGSWVTSTLDSEGFVGRGTSIAIGSNDNVHISYYDETNGDLRYATNAMVCNLPMIATQPQSQTIQSGQTASMSISATGTMPFSYQWYQGSSGNTSTPVGTNSSSFITPGLTQATSYWARVTNACGYADSTTATISMLVPPVAPTLISPSGTIATTTPTYTWNAAINAAEYYLWVNDSWGNRVQQWYTAAACGCGPGTGTCSVTPATALNVGAAQWWVQAKNPVGTSSWSASMSFTIQIPLGATTPLSPSAGSTITTATPAYTWTAVPAATWYYLSADDPSGNRILQWYTASAVGCGSGTGNCSVTPTTALGSGACNWKVQTWNSPSGYGPWSTVVNFTVNVPQPVATLVSPNGTITTATPSYIWNAVSGSTWYQLSVDDTAGNKIRQWYTAAACGCGSGTGNCTITPSTVLAAGAAKWKVQTWVNNGAGPWSSEMAFTVNVPGPPTPPIAPTLVSPSGTIATTTPAYSWNAVSNATDYYLWVNDSSGNKIATWYTAAASGCGSGTGTCSVTPATTLNAGAGQWWVQAKNALGTSPWSTPMSFTVSGGGGSGPPGAATLVSPSGAAGTNMPTYTWNAVSNSTWYYLWVNDYTGNKIATWYTAAQVGCSSGTGTCSLTPATTLASGVAKWWIQTWNSYGAGPWSAPMNFTVP